MVSSRSITLVGINTRHKVCLYVLGQLLYYMNALIVLSLRVHNINGFVFGYQYTLIANLSTHFAIERRIVKN